MGEGRPRTVTFDVDISPSPSAERFQAAPEPAMKPSEGEPEKPALERKCSLPRFPEPVRPMVPVEVDRYGWDRTLKDGRTPAEIGRDEAKERERESKWNEMLKNYEAFFDRRRRKVKERIKKGIPDSVRGRAWGAILGIDRLAEGISIGAYYNVGVPPDDQTILMDVPRTLPMNPVFQSRCMQVSCYRVLRAYANCDKEMGYAQGVGFHAGILLCYLTEDRAFRALYQLFMRRGVRDLFCEDFRGLQQTVACFNAFMGRRVPRVLKQLEGADLATMLFAPAWFLTAFIAVDLPIWMILRIFDCFLQFGVRSLVSFGLALLKCEEERLVGASGPILQMLQFPGQYMSCMSRPYEVIAEWHRQWITEDEWNAELQAAGRGGW